MCDRQLGIVEPSWYLSLFEKDQGTVSSWESQVDTIGEKITSNNYKHSFTKENLPHLFNKADVWTSIYWEDCNKRVFRSIIKTLRFTYNDTNGMLIVGGTYDVEMKDMKENIWKGHV